MRIETDEGEFISVQEFSLTLDIKNRNNRILLETKESVVTLWEHKNIFVAEKVFQLLKEDIWAAVNITQERWEQLEEDAVREVEDER